MKTKFYLALAVIVLSWMGCSQEEAIEELKGGTNVIYATIEGASRSTVTDAGKFSWTSNDQITVTDGSSKDTYIYSGTGDGFNLLENETEDVTTPVVSYYPANENHTTTTFHLPDTYGSTETAYVPNTNAAMMAYPPAEGKTYAFMHLGGVMRFNVKNVPVGTTEFSFTASDKKITGSFGLQGEGTKTIVTEDATEGITSGSTVTIKFKALEAPEDMTFYVPLPTGTYGDYTIALNVDGVKKNCKSENVSNTINRKTLLLMPTFIYENGQLFKNGSVGVINLEDGNKEASIKENAEVFVTPGNVADATATLNYTPATDGNSNLSISDGSADGTESGDSQGKVVVATATSGEDVTVASCDINAPTLSVTLSATGSGSVTYEQVTANTAKQTLVIGKGITVKNLIINGGNVEIEEGATVNSFEYEASEGVICVKFAGNVPEGLVSTDKIIYLPNDGVAVSSLEELNTALVNDVIKTIVLKNNIESNAIVNINRAVTLDLNKKTFSCTFNRFIRVENSTSNENAVTIKNGTISNGVSGGRCVETRSGNINLTLENLTLETTASSGWNQPFTIGGSGTNITVDITDCTIDAGAPGYGITTFNPVVMTIKNTTISGYSALNIKEADGSEGSKNSTFNIINSTLESINNASSDETNNFTTVMIEDDNIEINVDATSKLSAKANNNQSIFCIGNEVISEAITGVTVTVENGATLTLDGNNTYIFAINHKQVLGDNVFKFPANYAGQLNSEGYKTETENDLVKVVAICEAKVGDTMYETLLKALNECTDESIVTLIKDITLTETLTIEEGKTVDLDLNSKTITIDAAGSEVVDFKNLGTLNIYNGFIVAANEEASRRCIYNYGTMTIGKEDGTQGVSFTQTYPRKGAAINNEGILKIYNAKVEAVYYSIWTSGENAITTVYGGTFKTINDVEIRDTWAYVVNVLDKANFVVNDGTFTGNHGVISVTTGANATLNNGTFRCTAEYTGNSDWSLYANGSGSKISYKEACIITNENADGISCTENGGVVEKITSESNE